MSEELKTELLEPEKKQEKYSYSKIDTYKNCPFHYKLKYVDGNYVPFDSIATEFGTLIHETEEAIGNAIKDKQAIDYEALKDNFIKKSIELKAKYAKAWMETDKSNRTYEQKANEYLTSGIYRLENLMKEHPEYEIIGCEVEFDFLFNGKYLFHGFIDRIFYNKDTKQFTVQDIKSYAVLLDKEKLTTPLQFVVYTLAMAEKYKASFDDISCQYDLPLCDMVQDAGTKGYVDRGIKKLEELFLGIEGKDWKPAPCPLCAWCEFSRTSEFGKDPANKQYNLCPYYSLWTKDRKMFGKENEWLGMSMHPIIMENFRRKHHLV